MSVVVDVSHLCRSATWCLEWSYSQHRPFCCTFRGYIFAFPSFFIFWEKNKIIADLFRPVQRKATKIVSFVTGSNNMQKKREIKWCLFQSGLDWRHTFLEPALKISKKRKMNIIYTQPIYCICINIGQIIYYASIYLFLTCPKPVLLFFLLPLTLFSSSFPLYLFSYTLSYFLTHPQGMRKSLLWGRGLLDYRGPVFVLPPLVENDIRHNIQKHIIPQRSKAKRAIIKYCN